MAASEPQTRPPESMDLEISMDSKPPTSPSKSPGSMVKEEGVRPPTRHALAMEILLATVEALDAVRVRLARAPRPRGPRARVAPAGHAPKSVV